MSILPQAIDRPDPKVRLTLLYGGDESGSRALAATLLSRLGAEKLSFTGAALKTDPGLLAAEAGAISMFGENALLWIEPAAEDCLVAVETLLDAPAIEHPVVAIAGPLKKTSGLLKLVQSHKLAVAIESRPVEGRDAEALVRTLGQAEGLRIAPAAAARLAAASLNDRAVIGQELTKFALYLGATPDRPADLQEELLDVLGADSSEGDAGRAGDLALAGDLNGLTQELERIEIAGIDPIRVVRALQRRLLGMAPLRARVDGGQRKDAVMASVWGRDKAAVAAALPKWTSPRLAEVLDRTASLERSLLFEKVAPQATLGEALLAIARAAGR